jgi:hypothetical protein
MNLTEDEAGVERRGSTVPGASAGAPAPGTPADEEATPVPVGVGESPAPTGGAPVPAGTYVIDRFEGAMAVLEVDEGRTIDVPAACLPADASRGDVIVADGVGVRVDRAATNSRKQELHSLVSRLFVRKAPASGAPGSRAAGGPGGPGEGARGAGGPGEGDGAPGGTR